MSRTPDIKTDAHTFFHVPKHENETINGSSLHINNWNIIPLGESLLLAYSLLASIL